MSQPATGLPSRYISISPTHLIWISCFSFEVRFEQTKVIYLRQWCMDDSRANTVQPTVNNSQMNYLAWCTALDDLSSSRSTHDRWFALRGAVKAVPLSCSAYNPYGHCKRRHNVVPAVLAETEHAGTYHLGTVLAHRQGTLQSLCCKFVAKSRHVLVITVIIARFLVCGRQGCS